MKLVLEKNEKIIRENTKNIKILLEIYAYGLAVGIATATER